MDNQKICETLIEIKKDLIENIEKVGKYHNITELDIDLSTDAIDNFLSTLICFYSNSNDKSFRKALIFLMIENFKNTFISNLPICFPEKCESSIERLFATVLFLTAPQGWYDKYYLSFQEPICNGEYRIDIALMQRSLEYRNSDSNGIPVIGIECDGYNYHYNDSDSASKTLNRIRKIKMQTGIEILQYTGNEIYRKPFQIANDFWNYVLKKFPNGE